MEEMRVMHVTGKCLMSVKPDITNVFIELEGTYEEYGKALQKSYEDTQEIRDILSTLGFKKEDAKTISFDVDTAYEDYEENHIRKRKFAGYRYRHRLRISFENDNERLGRILFELSRASSKPELSMTYSVKNPKEMKKNLMKEAVKDAIEKASVLAEASEVTLKKIRDIDYSSTRVDVEVRPFNKGMVFDYLQSPSAAGVSYNLNIEPDYLRMTDTVTVTWVIE